MEAKKCFEWMKNSVNAAADMKDDSESTSFESLLIYIVRSSYLSADILQ